MLIGQPRSDRKEQIIQPMLHHLIVCHPITGCASSSRCQISDDRGRTTRTDILSTTRSSFARKRRFTRPYRRTDQNASDLRLGRRASSLICHPSSGWWSQTGSNRRPRACKARALPTELWPPQRIGRTTHDRTRLFADRLSSVVPHPTLVGLGGLEPPTSRLSSARSNQLSYKP